MHRIDGYAPIGSYAIIGDGACAALVAPDGSIDWWCLPDMAGAAVFAALLDPDRGGWFRVAPRASSDVERRYVGDTNVLETTFITDDGVVRVTDALTLQEGRLLPWRELVRRIEGVSGRVEMAWAFAPRFDYGRMHTRWHRGQDMPMAVAGPHAISVMIDNADGMALDGDTLHGTFTTDTGSRHLLGLAAVHDEPVVFPHLGQADARLDRTVRYWTQRAQAIEYDGPWREAVVRSGLTLQLLIQDSTGAIAAAATTSLPERIGGSANFDYRFQWVRDASFALDAFTGLGLQAQAHASFSALQRATRTTHPRLQPMYRLDGDPRMDQAASPRWSTCCATCGPTTTRASGSSRAPSGRTPTRR